MRTFPDASDDACRHPGGRSPSLDDGHVVGLFTYDVPRDAWTWDDEVFRIHGYEPGAVVPTTDLVLACKHPDDRDRVRRLIEHVARTGDAFSVSYRLVVPDGTERRVVLIGEGEGTRSERQIRGYYLDLTREFDTQAQAQARAAVAAWADDRAVIEQAKGVLMLAYGLSADESYALLRWWTRDGRTTVRAVAERLVELAGSGSATKTGLRLALDAQLHDLSRGQRS